MSAITPPQDDVAAQAAAHGRTLTQIRDSLDQLVTEIGLGGGEIDRTTDNLPLPGHKRFTVSGRRTQGNDNLQLFFGVTPAVIVAGPSPGRLAGQIVNSGANPALLYLARPSDVPATIQAGAGIGAIWLAGSGGAWDFRLSARTWCGAVSAVALVGNTTLTVVVV